jgi:hypothetical protein
MASHLICRKSKMREGIIIYFEVDIWSKLQNKFVFSQITVCYNFIKSVHYLSKFPFCKNKTVYI